VKTIDKITARAGFLKGGSNSSVEVTTAGVWGTAPAAERLLIFYRIKSLYLC